MTYGTVSAASCSRLFLGLPAEWEIIVGWLTDKTLPEPQSTVSDSKPEAKEKISGTVKNKVDWDTFPKKDIPSGPETRIDIEKLKNMVNANENNLLDHEVRRAQRAESNILPGTGSPGPPVAPSEVLPRQE